MLITPQVRCGCLRGRRVTCGHRPPLCVAGVALADMDVHFVWQVWRLWHSAALRGDIDLALIGTGLALVARLGLAGAVCVAGVALADIDLHFAWQV